VAAAISGAWPGAELAVVSRDPARAAEFAQWASAAGIGVWGSGVRDSGPADLVVNATPLGIRPQDPPPMDTEQLRRVAPAALLDLAYAVGGTQLVQAARECGIRAADGRGVLLAQGAASFQLFFGVPAPEEIMRAAVEDALRA
jgi:shikimate 5-dehydrogenase